MTRCETIWDEIWCNALSCSEVELSWVRYVHVIHAELTASAG